MQCYTVQPLYFFTINNHIGITLADDWMIMIKHTVKLHVSREKNSILIIVVFFIPLLVILDKD